MNNTNNLASVLEFKFPGSIRNRRTVVEDDGSGPTIVIWDSNDGPQPTPSQLATWESEWDAEQQRLDAYREPDRDAMLARVKLLPIDRRKALVDLMLAEWLLDRADDFAEVGDGILGL